MAFNSGRPVEIPFPEMHMFEEIMNRKYRLEVVPDPEGGYTIFYPDLPGCVTVIESLDELPLAAQEIKELWIAATIEVGQPIPDPTDS